MIEYQFALTLSEPQLGTVPKDKEIYKNFIINKSIDLELPVNSGEELETVPSSKEGLEERGWTSFHQDQDGIFIYDYMIRGFLKEAGNTIKDQIKIKNLRSKIDNLVFSFPRKVYFEDESGARLSQVDGWLERSLRVMTMQGPRVTLARSDYINAGRILKGTLKVVSDKEITEQALRDIFDYGALKGLGQFRNGSYGRFSYQLERVR